MKNILNILYLLNNYGDSFDSYVLFLPGYIRIVHKVINRYYQRKL